MNKYNFNDFRLPSPSPKNRSGVKLGRASSFRLKNSRKSTQFPKRPGSRASIGSRGSGILTDPWLSEASDKAYSSSIVQPQSKNQLFEKDKEISRLKSIVARLLSEKKEHREQMLHVRNVMRMQDRKIQSLELKVSQLGGEHERLLEESTWEVRTALENASALRDQVDKLRARRERADEKADAYHDQLTTTAIQLHSTEAKRSILAVRVHQLEWQLMKLETEAEHTPARAQRMVPDIDGPKLKAKPSLKPKIKSSPRPKPIAANGVSEAPKIRRLTKSEMLYRRLGTPLPLHQPKTGGSGSGMSTARDSVMSGRTSRPATSNGGLADKIAAAELESARRLSSRQATFREAIEGDIVSVTESARGSRPPLHDSSKPLPSSTIQQRSRKSSTGELPADMKGAPPQISLQKLENENDQKDARDILFTPVNDSA